jgi:hypothetical protein
VLKLYNFYIILYGTEATEVVILGNGTINGLNITSTGKVLVIPGSNGVPYIKGAADFKSIVERQLISFRQLEIMVLLSLTPMQQEIYPF